MNKNPTPLKLLLIGIPLEYQSAMTISLGNAQFTALFSMSKEEATNLIHSGELSAVIITSDFVFDDDPNLDLIELTYGKIPTLTLILPETFEKFDQGIIWGKVYNPEAFQEFCTAPFDMEELLPRLRKIIQKAQKAALN